MRPLQASVLHPPAPSLSKGPAFFAPNRGGIQLHLSRQALSPNLTSQGNITKTENSGDIRDYKPRSQKANCF